jgi:hypothetical protein
MLQHIVACRLKARLSQHVSIATERHVKDDC